MAEYRCRVDNLDYIQVGDDGDDRIEFKVYEGQSARAVFLNPEDALELATDLITMAKELLTKEDD